MTCNTTTPDDLLDGLPPDLVRLLRDPRIIVPQDQAVFELIASWANAPCDTPSALPLDLRSHELPRNSGKDAAVDGPTSLGEKDDRIAPA